MHAWHAPATATPLARGAGSQDSTWRRSSNPKQCMTVRDDLTSPRCRDSHSPCDASPPLRAPHTTGLVQQPQAAQAGDGERALCAALLSHTHTHARVLAVLVLVHVRACPALAAEALAPCPLHPARAQPGRPHTQTCTLPRMPAGTCIHSPPTPHAQSRIDSTRDMPVPAPLHCPNLYTL